MLIKEIEFLNPKECADIQTSIHLLKEHWTPRHGGLLPIFTLGGASYLDSNRYTDENYRKIGQSYNDLLMKHFPLMYNRLAKVLSAYYRLPAVYELNLAIPGFHIFRSHKLLEQPIATCHFDLQFQRIQWNYQEIDLAHPISFTAAISLPSEGGGLYYWDILYKDHPSASKQELAELASKSEKKYYPYRIGKLMVHDGLFLHQIAPGINLQPDDERITLQGHGLVCDGTLHLYW